MGKINELAISDSNVNMNIVEKYGTFRLQSDKQITENGKHTADVGFNGLSSVNVNVSGSAELEDNKTVSITENGVVEITPSEGKDGMKKVTATVNVSGGGVSTLYAFAIVDDEYVYYSTTLDLDVGDKLLVISVTGYNPANDITIVSYDSSTNTATDEYGTTYQYDSTKNISLT